MILSIFIIFVILALISWSVGNVMRMDALKTVGFTIIFLLGMLMLTNNLEYQTSTNITLVNSTYTVQPVYTTFDNHTVSFLFVLFPLLGFIGVMVDRKAHEEDD